MSRIDKYDSKDGGFRAPLGFALPEADIAVAIAVGLDANGRAVRGAGNTGILGVLVLTQVKAVGDIVDIMTDGELVEFPGVAGSTYFARNSTGAIEVGGAGGAAPVVTGETFVRVGATVESTRLVVRAAR